MLAKLNKPLKIVLGVATILPLFYVVVFVTYVLGVLAFLSVEALRGAGDTFIFAVFWIAALMPFYVLDIFETERVLNGKKALWVVLILVGNFFTLPVYWFLYVWREPETIEAEAVRGNGNKRGCSIVFLSALLVGAAFWGFLVFFFNALGEYLTSPDPRTSLGMGLLCSSSFFLAIPSIIGILVLTLKRTRSRSPLVVVAVVFAITLVLSLAVGILSFPISTVGH